jgi:PAS domain S-box-containing protein
MATTVLKAVQDISKIDLRRDLKQILTEILTIVGDEMDAHSGSIMLVNERTDKLEMVATFGLPDDYIERVYSRGVPLTSSPSGVVLSTGRYYLVPNVFEESRVKPWLDLARELGFSAQIFMPMKEKNKVTGLLNIYMANPHEFTESEIAFLTIAAGHAAAVIENAKYAGRLVEQINEHTAKLQATNEQLLQEIEERKQREKNLKSLMNISQIDLRQERTIILEKILTITVDEMGAFAGSITLINEETGKLEFAATYGLPDDYIERINRKKVPITNSPSGIVLETGRYYPVPNVFEEPRVKPWLDLARELGFSAQFFMPMKRNEEVIGLLNIYIEHPHEFTESEIAFLTIASSQAASVIENARLYAKVNAKKRILQCEIVERKRAEEALRDSEETARALLNASSDSVLLLDTNGIILAVNKSAALRLGKSAGELIGLRCYDLFPPEIAERRKAYNETVIRSGKPVTFKDKRGGCLFSSTVYPVLDTEGKVARLAVFARDITEQARAEASLKESEKKYRTLVENVPDIIFTLDKNRKFTSMNKTGLKLLGYRSDELIGQHFEKVVHPEDVKEIKQSFKRTRDLAQDFTIRLISKHRDVIWVSIDSSLTMDEQGEIVQEQGIARDLTAKLQAEEQKRRLCSVFERSIDGIAIGYLDLRLKYVNNAYALMHGYSTREMIGMNVGDLHNEVQIAKFKQCMNQVKIQGSWKGEIEQIKKDGTPFPTYLSVSLLKSADGKPTGILAVSRDLSEHEQVKKALKNSEKKYKEIAEFLPDSIYRDIQILS